MCVCSRFDKGQVTKAFDKKYGEKDPMGAHYVEKFVQLEFELPPKTTGQVGEFVKSVAPSTLKDNKAVLDIVSRFIQPNPRKILRWINRLSFIQELFRSRRGDTKQPQQIPEIVPVWVFIKSFFPEFASLVEKDQSVLDLMIRKARGEVTSEELERVKGVTVDKVLEDFLRSLSPEIIDDTHFPEVIFQTKLTITEGVSVLQPESLIKQIDEMQYEEVGSFATELIINSKGKALEVARLIGEKLATVRVLAQYTASQNRIRFLKRVVSSAGSESERGVLFEILMHVLKSLQIQYAWSFGPELKSLLSDPRIKKAAEEKGYIDIYVSNLADSGSFDYAGDFSEIVILFVDRLTQSQANRIALAWLSNDQVYNSFRAKPQMGRILRATKHLIDKQVWDQIEKQKWAVLQS